MTKNREPTHPGALLREDVLPALGVSVSQAAKDMGVTRQNLHRILREEGPVTAVMAVRLGAYCGNGPGLWLRMQTAHDLWKASRDMKDQAREIQKRSPASV
ncbi:MAG: HigA family addiction module antidote protein [Alphaproteobacteria bacterium]|nr:HigA family addiction module antidote protein [Alphaproteobacteria bacterium]